MPSSGRTVGGPKGRDTSSYSALSRTRPNYGYAAYSERDYPALRNLTFGPSSSHLKPCFSNRESNLTCEAFDANIGLDQPAHQQVAPGIPPTTANNASSDLNSVS